MIRNIIFDMGNVLIYFDPKTFLTRVGIEDPADRELLLREVYRSLEWAQMDRGSLTDAEAGQIMMKRVPEHLKKKVYELVCEWDRPILPVPGMAELVKELKENGYRIYLLSNASYHQHDYWQQIPGWEYFDGTLISADEKLVKPQPEIYALTCERFGLKPEENLFVDDAVGNAEGAVFSGWNAIVFHDDVAELRRKMQAMGVKVNSAN